MNHLPFNEALEDCSRLAGKVPQALCLDQGDFPVIGQGKQEVDGFTNDSGLVFRGGLPVILFGDHTAAFKFVDRPFARGADGTKLFRPRTQLLDAKYAWHFLQTVKLPDTGYDRKTKYLENLKIPLPPLEEQRRIAAILDKTSKLQELSGEAEELAKAITTSLFEKTLSARDWPTALLGDVVTRLTNGYVGPTRGIYVEEGIPYLLARHVKEGVLSYDGRTLVSHQFNAKNKKSILAEGDVLLVQSGHIGSSCVVPAEHAGHNCHAMIVITPDHQVISGGYLSALFETPRMQREFKGIQTGITVPHLNCRDVRKMEIPVPPLEVQHELDRKLAAISLNITALQARRGRIKLLSRSMSSNFF